MKPQLQRVPVSAMRFDEDDRLRLRAFDEQERLVHVPLHRIRKVYRSGQVIWNRDVAAVDAQAHRSGERR